MAEPAFDLQPLDEKVKASEQWYVIVDEKGQERSSGTVIAETLPDGWQAIPIEKMPDASKETWDKDAQSYVTKPVANEPPVCPSCGRAF